MRVRQGCRMHMKTTWICGAVMRGPTRMGGSLSTGIVNNACGRVRKVCTPIQLNRPVTTTHFHPAGQHSSGCCAPQKQHVGFSGTCRPLPSGHGIVSGHRLSASMSFWTSSYGGGGCNGCKRWSRTMMELVRERTRVTEMLMYGQEHRRNS